MDYALEQEIRAIIRSEFALLGPQTRGAGEHLLGTLRLFLRERTPGERGSATAWLERFLAWAPPRGADLVHPREWDRQSMGLRLSRCSALVGKVRIHGGSVYVVLRQRPEAGAVALPEGSASPDVEAEPGEPLAPV